MSSEKDVRWSAAGDGTVRCDHALSIAEATASAADSEIAAILIDEPPS
jgi:hypothetical protein